MISAVCDHYPQLRKRTRTDRDGEDRDRKRDRTDDRRKPDASVPAAVAEPQKPAEQSIEERLRAKEMMYKAQQEIEETKRKMAIAAGTLQPKAALAQAKTQMVAPGGKSLSLGRDEATMLMTHSMDKKSRMEELKARLARTTVMAKIDAMVGNSGAGVMAPLPEAVQQAEKKVQQQITKESKEPEKLIEYLDPRIQARTADRRRRGFNFHEKGEFEKLANKQRAMAKLERLQNEVSSAAQSTGISSAVKLAMVTPTGTAKMENGVPDIEWWDMLVLDKVK